MRRPLHKDSTDEEWQAEAERRGVSSGAAFKEQVMLADSTLEELFRDEEDDEGVAS